MMKHIVRLAPLLAILVLWSLPASRTAQAQAEWVAALRGGGHVIVFLVLVRRDAFNVATRSINFANLDKQRPLNDAGRAKAREIGEAFRKLKIPVGQVHTSMFNRAIETGKLAFGEAMPTPDLTEGVVTPIENHRRALALRKLAATVPPAGTNVVAVTHKPNILDAFGKDWFEVREGEASLFKPDGVGGSKLVMRVQADDWMKLAQAAN